MNEKNDRIRFKIFLFLIIILNTLLVVLTGAQLTFKLLGLQDINLFDNFIPQSIIGFDLISVVIMSRRPIL